MKKIKNAMRELKDTLVYFGLFTSIFDSLVLFAVLVLVFYLLNLSWLYTLLVVIPYLFLHTRRIVKRLNLRFVENIVPDLNEELRTSCDTRNTADNEIVDSLHEDTIKKMKKIKTSYFLNLKKLTRQIVFLAIISFALVAVSAYNVRFIDIPQTILDLQNFGSNSAGQYGFDESLLDFEEMDEDADIFGNKSVAELGNKELILEINPLMNDIDISRVSDPKKRYFDEIVPPTEIEANTDASYEEAIAGKYRRIVKTYFNGISQTK